MISTTDFSKLPGRETLKNICKSISVLDAIISQEWQYRYYSYNSMWDKDEECLQMRNGSGDEMHILFRVDGSAINGFAHEYEQADKAKLTQNLPAKYNDFIFGERVTSVEQHFACGQTKLIIGKLGKSTLVSWYTKQIIFSVSCATKSKECLAFRMEKK